MKRSFPQEYPGIKCIWINPPPNRKKQEMEKAYDDFEKRSILISKTWDCQTAAKYQNGRWISLGYRSYCKYSSWRRPLVEQIEIIPTIEKIQRSRDDQWATEKSMWWMLKAYGRSDMLRRNAYLKVDDGKKWSLNT